MNDSPHTDTPRVVIAGAGLAGCLLARLLHLARIRQATQKPLPSTGVSPLPSEEQLVPAKNSS